MAFTEMDTIIKRAERPDLPWGRFDRFRPEDQWFAAQAMYVDGDGTWRTVDHNTTDGPARREFVALIEAHAN